MTTPEPVVSTPIDQHAKAVFALAEELGASPFSSEPPTEHIRRLIERLADELNVQAERIAGLERERDDWRKECELNLHRILTCGVAATHSNPDLTLTGAYIGKWNTQQADSVRALRAKLIAAELALSRANAALEEERERCAKVCDEGVKWTPNFPPNIQRVSDETCFLLAKAIRALSTQQEKP